MHLTQLRELGISRAGAGLEIDRLLNEARALKLVKDAEIGAAIERCPRRKRVPMQVVAEIARTMGRLEA